MSFHKTVLSILAMTVFYLNISVASNTAFPHGCEVTGFGFNLGHLVLNENGTQAFYLLQNRSDTVIELQRYETREAFMSPPLTAKLDSSHWAAFASDVENQNFECFNKDQDNMVKIDCRDVLEVCKYPRVKFALSNMGNYWVSVNKPQAEVINEAAGKGILLRW